MFEAAVRKFGVNPSDLKVTLEPPSNEAVRAAVEAGDCATAKSDPVVDRSLAARTLHRVRIEMTKRCFFAVRHKERHQSHAEKALLQAFRI